MNVDVLLNITHYSDRTDRMALLNELVESGHLGGSITFGWQDALRRASTEKVLEDLRSLVERFQPSLVLWEHPGGTPVSEAVRRLRCLLPRIIIGYREADAFGFLRKRLPSGARELSRLADVVFPVGKGSLEHVFRLAGARRLCYVPNSARELRFSRQIGVDRGTEYDVVMIGNRIPSRRPWVALPGSGRREQLARKLGARFGKRFLLVGHGWQGYRGAVGAVDIDELPGLLKRASINVGWNHFDRTPFYFSGRLAVCLLAGAPTINNAQPGYSELFRDGVDILLARSVDHAVDLVENALDQPESWLKELAHNGQAAAKASLATEKTFPRMIERLSSLHANRPKA